MRSFIPAFLLVFLIGAGWLALAQPVGDGKIAQAADAPKPLAPDESHAQFRVP
jgi:hypothetical protein